MVDIAEYRDPNGQSPFQKWFDGLNPQAAAKVATALERIERGSFSSVKGVGQGVFEFRIDWGPGYRIYFGKDGEKWVILLGGGSKKRQSQDILAAKERWILYKTLKRKEN